MINILELSGIIIFIIGIMVGIFKYFTTRLITQYDKNFEIITDKYDKRFESITLLYDNKFENNQINDNILHGKINETLILLNETLVTIKTEFKFNGRICEMKHNGIDNTVEELLRDNRLIKEKHSEILLAIEKLKK